MPPYVPEEVDVFTVPHSRMKELVNNYFAMVQSTNFTDILDLQQLLESLSQTFREFKTHEQIENQFIMKRLKHKLKQLSIRNTAVCNCHKDNALTDMMRLLQDGYKKKTDQDRLNYGLKLKKALEDFTDNFLPHMKEEEEVFQPLLLEYFSYEELCELKQKVIQQHLEQELEKTKWMSNHMVKEAEADTSSSSDGESDEDKINRKFLWTCEFSKQLKKCHKAERTFESSIETLPPEIMLKIFNYLSPRELCQVQLVNSRWSRLAMDPTLWKNILPAQWARGDWSFTNHTVEDDEDGSFYNEDECFNWDDDADIDESLDSNYSEMIQQGRKEARILTGLCEHILPKVGHCAQRLVLGSCRTLKNGMLQTLLSLCPNVELLDVSQTRISDIGLKRLGKNGCGSRLTFLNFSGCIHVTDATLVRLAVALDDSSNIHTSKANRAEEDTAAADNDCLCEMYYKTYKKNPSDGSSATPQESRCACGAPATSVNGVPVCNKCDRGREVSLSGSTLQNGQKPKDITHDNCDGTKAVCCPSDKCKDNCGNGPCGGGCMCGETPETDKSTCDKSIEKQEIEENNDFHAGKSSDKQNSPVKNGTSECKSTKLVATPTPISSNEQNIPVPCHSSCEPEVVPSKIGSLEDCSLARYLPADVTTTPSAVCYEAPSLPGSGERHCCRKSGSYNQKHRRLVHLNLSGCFRITDIGLRALAGSGVFSNLQFLDVSGCFHMSAEGLEAMVRASPRLSEEHLYYCDNILDGPFADTASGCRNLECSSRVCCRSGK